MCISMYLKMSPKENQKSGNFQTIPTEKQLSSQPKIFNKDLWHGFAKLVKITGNKL